MEKYYEINAPAVISEPMEDEVVVINLDNGCYYNLNKSAAQVWNFLDQGCSLNQIASHAAKSYPGETECIGSDFQVFAQRLTDEQLVREIEGHNVGKINANGFDGQSYEKPDFDKFSDMQEMLLLDPIHEVSEEGWPHQKKSND
ncbi:MAG: PqqD family protein [Desulfocapsa sp.]|nr:PqqD family protein [Desulfocapsa sp.]